MPACTRALHTPPRQVKALRAWAVVLHAQEKPAAAVAALHCCLELVEGGGGLVAPMRGDPTPPGVHHNAVVRDAAKAHLHLCRPLLGAETLA